MPVIIKRYIIKINYTSYMQYFNGVFLKGLNTKVAAKKKKDYKNKVIIL